MAIVPYKKDALIEMIRSFALSRDYYLNYGYDDPSGKATRFHFHRHTRGYTILECEIHVVWDELNNVFDAFEGIKKEVDGKLTRVEYDFKLTKETMDYMRHDLASTQLAIYTMMCEPKTEILKSVPKIEKVVFNDPATIVFWSDKTKTVVKCGERDIYDPEKGLAMAITKKALGNQGNYYNEIKKWLPEEKEELIYPRIEFAFSRFSEAVEYCRDSINRLMDRLYNDRTRPIGKVTNVEESNEGVTATVELDPDLPKLYYLWYHGPDSMAWHRRNYAYKDKRSAERYAKKHFPEDWTWKVTQDYIWAKDEPEDYTWEYMRGEHADS